MQPVGNPSCARAYSGACRFAYCCHERWIRAPSTDAFRSMSVVAREMRAHAGTILDPYEAAVLVEAAHRATDPLTLAHVRIQHQVGALCRWFRPRALLVTYEGHAWERQAFAAARGVDPDIRCVGYQHTILFPRQHAIRRSLGWPFDPDVILTAGDVTHELLAAGQSLSGTKLIT